MKYCGLIVAAVLALGTTAAQAQHHGAYAPPPTYAAAPAYGVAGGDCSCQQPALVAPPLAVQPAPVVAYRPVVPVQSGMYVGQGAWGQPTVYLPGQPMRNFFRAITW